MNKLLGKQWVLGSDTAISPCGQSFSVHEPANNIARHIAACSACATASELVSAYNKIVESLPVTARIELDHWVHKVPWSWTDERLSALTPLGRAHLELTGEMPRTNAVPKEPEGT